MAGFDNEVLFCPGERLETSSAQSIQLMQQVATDVSRINYIGDPNGVVAANPSSISHDPVSGYFWLKTSGTGTTVWQRIFFANDVDAHTAPGTDPVLPNSSGAIVVTGGQVATGVIGNNVIRTNSLAANTYTTEIQRSTAVAASDITKNGVSHFDSAYFSVDSSGFVSSNTSVSFNAYVDSDTAGNKTGDGTEYTVICNTELFDIGNNYNTTTGIFTAPKTATYIFTTHINTFGIGVGTQSCQCYIVVSGNRFRISDENGYVVRANPGSNDALGRGGSVIAQMTAGDTAYVYVEYQGGAKTVGIQGKNGNPQIRSWFCGKIFN